MCILAVLILFYLVDSLVFTDEERMHLIIDETKKGIEEEDLKLVFEYVSVDYHDIYGLSRDRLEKIAENMFSKFEDFKVIIEKENFNIEENGGSVNLSFWVLVTYNGQRTFLFGTLNETASCTILFEKDDLNDIGWLISGIENLKSRWPVTPKMRQENLGNSEI